MSRRAAAQTIRPVVAFWRTGSFRFACAGVLFCGLASLTWWMQEENAARQMRRRLHDDTTLSRLATQWSALIPAKPPPVKTGATDVLADQSPRAVWFGKVSRFQSAPDMSLLTLSDAILVAGERARSETGSQVRAAPPRGYRFLNPPAAGEMWLVAVTRNEEGGNIIQFAEKSR